MFIKTHSRGLCSAMAFELLKATPRGDLFAANAGGFISILFIRWRKCWVEAGKRSCCFYFLPEPAQQGKEVPCRGHKGNATPPSGMGTEVLGVAGRSAPLVSLTPVNSPRLVALCLSLLVSRVRLQHCQFPSRHDQPLAQAAETPVRSHPSPMGDTHGAGGPAGQP